MRMKVAIMGLAIVLAGCSAGTDSAGSGESQAKPADVVNQSAAAPSAETKPAGPAACPFQSTHGWQGFVEGGKLIVNGTVDLMMAGFKPTLTARAGASSGAIALDLALTPTPGAAVSSNAHYEGPAGARRAEIYCGGQKIEEFKIYQ